MKRLQPDTGGVRTSLQDKKAVEISAEKPDPRVIGATDPDLVIIEFLRNVRPNETIDDRVYRTLRDLLESLETPKQIAAHWYLLALLYPMECKGMSAESFAASYVHRVVNQTCCLSRAIRQAALTLQTEAKKGVS